MNSRQTTLSDMVGKTIEFLRKTFTVDWIDAPGQPNNGKIMIQSDETEIHSELRKEAKRKKVVE